MNVLFKSKAGLLALAGFVALMTVMGVRVANRHRSAPPSTKETAAAAVAASGPEAPRRPAAPVATAPRAAAALAAPEPIAAIEPAAVAENAAYLDRYLDLDQPVRTDHDRVGNGVTRRKTAHTPQDSGKTSTPEVVDAAPAPPPFVRASLRFEGRAPNLAIRSADGRDRAERSPTAANPAGEGDSAAEPSATVRDAVRATPPSPRSGTTPARARPSRFNPYGRVIKCELVFTIDSTNEQTPLVALVMEPVYNNGSLVIPAGAELHGTTRPDRLRDRIFSGTDWVLVFPREEARPNGRQLNVRGVALDRVEPDSNGMTWGITDGSYGLEGVVIRTLQQEEIKRFVATFLASGSLALQDRQTDRAGERAARNTPQNAVLQGLGANFQRIVDEITAEIEQHGVFIRVPAGHQFYFYPMQLIDPDAADISADIATVR